MSREGTLARVLEQIELMKAGGWPVEPTVVELGREVNELGVDNARRSRKAYEDSPFAGDLAAQAQLQIRKEHRADTPAEAGQLRMSEEGLLFVPGIGPLPVTPHALQGLMIRVAPAAGVCSYIADTPPLVRSWNVNYWVDQFKKKKLKIRHRERKGQREVFAIVGPEFSEVNVADFAEMLANQLPPNARGSLTYDDRRMRFEVLFHSDLDATQYAAGEVFKVGIAATSADDGFESYRLPASLLRNLCINLLVLQESRRDSWHRTHRGNSIQEDIKEGIQSVYGFIAPFSEAWTAAERDRVIEEALGEKGVEAAFGALVKNRLVTVPRADSETVIPRLMQAWNQEPGYNRTAILNAITRAAHTNPWSSPWAEEELERQAGQLLFRRRIDLN